MRVVTVHTCPYKYLATLDLSLVVIKIIHTCENSCFIYEFMVQKEGLHKLVRIIIDMDSVWHSEKIAGAKLTISVSDTGPKLVT